MRCCASDAPGRKEMNAEERLRERREKREEREEKGERRKERGERREERGERRGTGTSTLHKHKKYV